MSLFLHWNKFDTFSISSLAYQWIFCSEWLFTSPEVMSCEVKSCVFVKYNNDAFFFYFKPLLPAKIQVLLCMILGWYFGRKQRFEVKKKSVIIVFYKHTAFHFTRHLRLVSWTWKWVNFSQMASTVTRSQSKRAPLGCGSHHGCAAY